jgi:hypothetical protein
MRRSPKCDICGHPIHGPRGCGGCNQAGEDRGCRGDFFGKKSHLPTRSLVKSQWIAPTKTMTDGYTSKEFQAVREALLKCPNADRA